MLVLWLSLTLKSKSYSSLKDLSCVHMKSEKVKVAQSCPPLCDPMDCSQPWNSVHGVLQARRVAFPIQGLNLHLLHWQADSSPLHCLGRPFINYTVYITATTHI